MSHLIMQQNQMMNVQGQVTKYIQICPLIILLFMTTTIIYESLFLDAKYPHESVAKYVDATRRHG